jgi:hypothetical protein
MDWEDRVPTMLNRICRDETMTFLQLHWRLPALVGLLAVVACSGCRSPYYADRGALAGGLAGAGVGALVGNAVGSTAAGTAIGAGVGALTGGAIGNAMDEVEAKNRAEIAARLGRPVAQGAATVEEVVAMTRAGVAPTLIVNYVNNSGVARPVNAQDVIYLSQQGVPTEVIDAMQRPLVASQPVHVAAQPAPPVIVEHVYGPPYYCPPPRRHFYYHHHHHHRHSPRVGFGISISN